MKEAKSEGQGSSPGPSPIGHFAGRSEPLFLLPQGKGRGVTGGGKHINGSWLNRKSFILFALKQSKCSKPEAMPKSWVLPFC